MRNEKSGNTIKKRLEFYSTPEPNTGCWLWIGSNRGFKNHQYGVLNIKGKSYSAHRLSYQEYKGEIPKGYDVMHKCDTPACINPDHLSVGTRKQNMHDCINKNRNLWMLKRSHCKNGHAFDEENTRIKLRKDRNNPDRICRSCDRARRRIHV